MPTARIALANLRYPSSADESVALATQAIAEAGDLQVDVIGFPECFVPGYRVGFGKERAAPTREFLEAAWSAVRAAAGKANVAVVLGTERIDADGHRITALVVNRDGSIAGFQDKVQLDPSEDALYTAGLGRRVFHVGALTFGIAICHEGFRYPETVRAAARQGAQLVFHPHYSEAEPGSYRPASYADPANTFHEKAVLCRAAENTCYIATVNCASEGSPTSSAIARPDGTLLSYQPYGSEGLLVADLDLAAASLHLASRWRTA